VLLSDHAFSIWIRYPYIALLEIYIEGCSLSIAAVSWSGGKDSYLAMHIACEKGYRPYYAVHMFVENIVSYHGPPWLLMSQVGALGITGIFARTSWEGYEEDFKAILRRLRSLGVEKMIFGDIYIEAHRQWVDKVCEEVGIEALEPLWGSNSYEVVKKALEIGVKPLIIRAYDEEPLSKYVGKILDWSAIEDFVRNGIDPAGEHGEYHTVVIDAPLYRYRIEILDGKIETVEGKFRDKIYRYKVFIPRKYRYTPKQPFPP
jgi:uncharacterized protein (TIGR00290 family)